MGPVPGQRDLFRALRGVKWHLWHQRGFTRVTAVGFQMFALRRKPRGWGAFPGDLMLLKKHIKHEFVKEFLKILSLFSCLLFVMEAGELCRLLTCWENLNLTLRRGNPGAHTCTHKSFSQAALLFRSLGAWAQASQACTPCPSATIAAGRQAHPGAHGPKRIRELDSWVSE